MILYARLAGGHTMVDGMIHTKIAEDKVSCPWSCNDNVEVSSDVSKNHFQSVLIQS